MSGSWYVYAVCRPFDEPLDSGLTGVAGAPPELLRHRDLVAVVGEVPEGDFCEAALRARLEDLDWLAATARRHDEVLAALSRVTSPLPLRLATVFHARDGVREMLHSRYDDFENLLERLAGRVEWGVKVYAEPAADAGRAAGGGPDRPASGRDYLRRRRAERDGRERSWQYAEEFAGRLRRVLAGHSAAERLHRPQSAELSGAPGRNVLNAAYLVDRERAAEFAEAVRRADGEAPGLRVELTGPWAAYSFGAADSADADAADAADSAESGESAESGGPDGTGQEGVRPTAAAVPAPRPARAGAGRDGTARTGLEPR
ncbi:gas vesicle protein [Streptomyces sulfonofaciens]|uniref:Gas vesicle protein n=1 Tax=Streptomyces sulfonofaciens TaxID=68272 RepID=A0A919L509_9ACTN|nr:gas vesicle protein [Streptomyces sulfonofaciens]